MILLPVTATDMMTRDEDSWWKQMQQRSDFVSERSLLRYDLSTFSEIFRRLPLSCSRLLKNLPGFLSASNEINKAINEKYSWTSNNGHSN